MKIVTHTSSTDRDWSKLCIQTQKEFAEANHIPHIVYEDINVAGRSLSWSRFRILQGETASAPHNEVTIWMDSDLMIMNPNYDLIALAQEFGLSEQIAWLFVTENSLDLGIIFIKTNQKSKEAFDYGWSIGESEARGNRGDSLSFELMNLLMPDDIYALKGEDVISGWYPSSPFKYYNHKIDSMEGQLGLFTMKKPREMVEGFKNLYTPGKFSVHLKEKGPALQQKAEGFYEYRKSFLKAVEESNKLKRDL
jgi:hypothetical protein